MTRAFHLLSLACLMTAAFLCFAEEAEACACCDGSGSRTIVGWSGSGRSALVERESWAACEHQRRLEVWRAGQDAPAHCFDLYAEDPDARTECDLGSLSSEYAATADGRTLRPSTRGRFFPKQARAIERRHLLVTLARRAPSEEDDFCSTPRTLTIALRSAPSEPLLTADICLSAPDDVAGDMAEGEWLPNPIEATVYPAPAGERALVFYRGNDSAPGTGFFGTSAQWARLPAALRDYEAIAPLLTTDPAAGAETALPAPARRARGAERRFANRYNREGLVAHRAGRYDDSARLFFRAVRRDPGHVHAWYNLACAEVRRGRAYRAMDILRILDEWDCAACAERIRRTASDPDFASIARDPELRRMIEANQE